MSEASHALQSRPRTVDGVGESEVPKGGAEAAPASPEVPQYTKPRAVVMSMVATMLGSSLLSLSYGYSQAGIIGGPLVVIFAAVICAQTAILIVRTGDAYTSETGHDAVDFPSVAAHFVGKWAIGAGSLASLIVLTGAYMAYFVYIASYLGSIGTCFGVEIPSYVCVGVAILTLGVLSLLRDVRRLVSIAQMGIVFTAILSGVVVLTGLRHIPQQTCSVKGYLFQRGVAKLFGITISQFMLHNLLLGVLKGTHPSARTGILRVTLLCLCLVNMTVGMAGYMGYRCEGVPQNFSELFPHTPIGSLIYVIQLVYIVSVFPLLQMVVRDNIGGLYFFYTSMRAEYTPLPESFEEEEREGEGEGERDGDVGDIRVEGGDCGTDADAPSDAEQPRARTQRVDILISVVMLCMASFISLKCPQVGDILGICGAAGGLIYVFILPLLCYRALEKREHRWNPMKAVGTGVLILIGGLGLCLQAL
ncbi:hypothetical protein KIPB_007010 [Kipferlia bialata]|uniref:Amino acid transporter transmembrane domain-containing protein n=1 Tax=Kipferlia bialata TaxID=797122 RepID=A0A9K3CVW5_9EUKA|nr:hypothetical protein KIPB_003734 [Kipferlia bialata]GIQ83242.1 hypothetical protein KIPB_004533 [Kipferlia bialata]GIQ83942.1 hypothetical protein KIPB_005349 [Kipferlia bialata]GIQ85360.1 hypothetical protein KIPB_007010 [Kipferlia bialata]|eukprot:g3734.t1